MPNAVEKPLYAAGDIGPAGGFIFYDKGFTSDGWRYLEAAPAGAEFKAAWGLKDIPIPGTGEGIGSGKKNTALIVSKGGSATAAFRCTQLTINGFNDWFLPSKDELDVMYHSLHKRGLGYFLSALYWSSSERQDGKQTWSQRFSDGYQDYYNDTNYNFRSYELSVRGVRAF